MRQIKLIWDFHGTDAAKTAQHHTRHLNEYLVAQNYTIQKSGNEEMSDFHHTAWMVVLEDDLIQFRDALKPHRAVYFIEE